MIAWMKTGLLFAAFSISSVFISHALFPSVTCPDLLVGPTGSTCAHMDSSASQSNRYGLVNAEISYLWQKGPCFLLRNSVTAMRASDRRNCCCFCGDMAHTCVTSVRLHGREESDTGILSLFRCLFLLSQVLSVLTVLLKLMFSVHFHQDSLLLYTEFFSENTRTNQWGT